MEGVDQQERRRADQDAAGAACLGERGAAQQQQQQRQPSHPHLQRPPTQLPRRRLAGAPPGSPRRCSPACCSRLPLQAKELLTRYGSAYLVTSISCAVVSMTACYLAVDAGVDVACLLARLGLNVRGLRRAAGAVVCAGCSQSAQAGMRGAGQRPRGLEAAAVLQPWCQPTPPLPLPAAGDGHERDCGHVCHCVRRPQGAVAGALPAHRGPHAAGRQVARQGAGACEQRLSTAPGAPGGLGSAAPCSRASRVLPPAPPLASQSLFVLLALPVFPLSARVPF